MASDTIDSDTIEPIEQPEPIDVTDPELAVDAHVVGRILGLANITLAQQRARGEGPPFFRLGRSVRYRLGDVMAWRQARTVGAR